MGVRFSDGFDLYGVTADLTQGCWGSVASWTFNATGGRNGGGCIQSASVSTNIISTGGSMVIATNQTYAFGFWLKVGSGNSSTTSFFQPVDGAGNQHAVLRLGATGLLSLFNADTASTIATGTSNVADGNWHWIEWVTSIGANSNAQKCYVDGNLQWSTTTTFAANSTVDHLVILGTPTATMVLDDIFLFDTLNGIAPQPANVPLGPRQITTKLPTSDTATVQFSTSSGGTHFSLVNEVGPDYDTTYVQDNASGHKDIYNFGALGFAPATVTSVVVKSCVKCPSPGSVNFNNLTVSNAVESDSANILISNTGSYLTKQSAFDQDPNTSAAWLAAAVDAATFGVKVT